MKYLLTILCLFCITSISILQSQCDPPVAMIDLDVNNVRARLLTGGDLWWDRSDASYFTPKNHPNGAAAIFAGGLWIGGVDPGGNLKVSAQTYGASNGNNNFWPGPLDPSTGLTTSDFCANFDIFFPVTRADIETHIADFDDNGIIDGPVPTQILRWPGKGNPEFQASSGWSLPAQDLAPFVDRNSDGIYDPNAGDFPKIKGDEAIWWVMNDIGDNNISGNPNFNPVQMEIQAMAYACSDPESALDNTTFYEFTYINRAAENIDQFIASLWVDPDLGCYTDDLIGSSPEHKMAVVYNEDAVDGDPGSDCPAGVPTYAEDIPILGIKVLDSSPNDLGEDVGFSSFMYFMNAAFNPPPGASDPQQAQEYFNYMRGLWRDGTPLTEGGSGYSPGSTDTVLHAFSGDPSMPAEWSLCSSPQPQADRRIVLNSGPYNLAPGENVTVTYAVITQLEAEYPCPSYETIIQLGEEIANQCDALTNASEKNFSEPEISIMPNPMSDFAEIKAEKILERIVVLNTDGRVIQTHSKIQSNQYRLNKDDLSPGIYFLQIRLNNNEIQTKKIVVL